MTISFDSRMAKALGISEDIYARFQSKEAPPPLGAADEERARFDLIGPIVDDDFYALFGKPEGITAPSALKAFLSEHKGENIEININSVGGQIWEANAMFSELLRHKGEIDIVVSGLCASAATFFLALPKANRIAMPGAEFMIHNVHVCMCGDHHKLRKEADLLEKSTASSAKRMAEAMGAEIEAVLSMMDAETWFSDEEALESGLVDSIYEPSESEKSESKYKYKKSEAVLAGEEARRNKLSLLAAAI